MPINLKQRWLNFAGEILPQAQCQLLWDDIHAGYTEPGRAYHNLEHIADVLSHFDRVRVYSDDPDLIEMAIWFHDLIYVIGSHSNEADSAAVAVKRLKEAGWADEDGLLAIQQYILETQHKAPASTADGALLCDIDLAILGSEPDRFWRYEREIRAEYKPVPWQNYRTGRAQVLRTFLDRPKIYQTDLFHDRYDVVARRNLARSIERLDQGLSESEFF